MCQIVQIIVQIIVLCHGFSKKLPIISIRGANLCMFCSPVSPDHRTLDSVVTFKNQQEFLCAAFLHPARQTTAEKGGESSHVGNFGVFQCEIIHEKGNWSIILYDKFSRSLSEPEIFRFVPQSISPIFRGICTTEFELNVAEKSSVVNGSPPEWW